MYLSSMTEEAMISNFKDAMFDISKFSDEKGLRFYYDIKMAEIKRDIKAGTDIEGDDSTTN